jgi:flagellar hook-associated protein 3 FlgL
MADSVRAGTVATTQTELTSLGTAMNRMTSALADVGTRTNRLDRAAQSAKDAVLELTSSLSEIENVDLARATMDLKMQEVAYQAALASTARLVQPSLADFLR